MLDLFQGSIEKKRFINNLFSLSILQGANYIFPLLTIPYLVRILKPEYFGLLAFATATITYLVLITDYGFNLSATRQIAIHRNSPKEIGKIFSSVIIIKTGLMLLSFLLISILVFSINKFRDHWEIYYLTSGILIGQVAFPVWLFQGLEKMKFITIINICAKTFFTLCIFLFVKDNNDYPLVPLFNSLGFILSGLLALFLVFNKFNIEFKWQPMSELKFQLIEGWHVFLSSISISLYTVSITFLLGIYASNSAVGYFSGAEKIIQSAKGLFTPISQTMYPLISNKIIENKKEGLRFIFKMTWFLGIVMFVFSFLIFLFAEEIIFSLLGQEYKESILFLKIMAFLPFTIALSNMFGIQTMLNLGYKKQFSNILVSAAFLGLGLSVIFMDKYEAIAASSISIFVEIFVTMSMAYFLYVKFKKKL